VTMRFLVCGLIAILLSITACSSKPSPASNLVKMTDYFSNRMRWQDYNHAAIYVVTEEREAFEEGWKEFKDDLHVVGTKIDMIEMLDPETAEVTMTIDYYLLPSASVKQVVSVQQWRYREGEGFEVGSWELVSGVPVLPEYAEKQKKNE